ncbi:MAG TPA: sigma-54 dependent transcriptional regulator [Gemmatimonadales bacterium]|nr:sigma-54 dependent transcriptional regulator [Gemmatimonadales bacterium]
MKPRVLIADDEANIRRMLAALLKEEGFEPEQAANGNAAMLMLDQVHPDAILLDLQMPPGPDGLETLRQIRERDASTLIIMMSGKAQLTDAVQAIKLGAFQFLEKPLTPEAVLVALRSGLELTRARAETRALRAQLSPKADLVGTGVRMEEVRSLIAQVAPTEARVLIMGESGTGKELVAHAIHRGSHRAGRPIISVNCAAIPRDLVESELFGHERGAFTGAIDRRLGRFELADGGTLFLDEVGDLNLEAQAKLLRVLETGEIQRLGAERAQRVDVRVLSATNQRLEQAVAAGTFREDLYFRLNVFPLSLAPLRERLEDLPELVEHLAKRIRPHQPVVFTAEAIAELATYDWPGNVRELANIVERLSILGGGEVDAALVRQVVPRSGAVRFEYPAVTSESGTTYSVAELGGRSLSNVLDDYERALIGATLKRAGGNVAEAARALQTDRANMYRRMKRLGL